jgi:4-amino-4-deoxy-L-arabinose transferase-like glycosyltransferase
MPDSTVRKTKALLLGVTLLAFALRLYHLGFQSLWRDEVDAVLFAGRDLPSILATFVQPGQNGPLYFLSLHFWLAAAGRSEFALRFFSLFFGLLTVPLVYALGRRLLGTAVGLVAALLLAVSPYHVWYSQEGKMYALVAFLAVLSLYLFSRALAENRWGWWLGYLAVTGLALYVHFFTPLLILVALAWFLLSGRLGRPALGRLVLALAGLALVALPIARWLLPTLLTPTTTGYTFYGLGDMAMALFWAFSLGFRPQPGLLPAALFVLLLLAGLVSELKPALVKEKRWPFNGMSSLAHPRPAMPEPTKDQGLRTKRPLLAAWLVLPVLVVYLVSLSRPVFTDRYLILILPAFVLLLAAGLVGIARCWPRYLQALMYRGWLPLAALTLTLVLLFSARGLWVQSQTPLKADFRHASQAFAAQAQPDDLVLFIMPYAQRAFAYYYPQPLPVAEAPYTNYGLSEAELDAAMRQLTQGSPRLWLLLSEADFWDASGLIPAWCEAHARRLSIQTFPYVELRLYDLADGR